ncbi:MAG: hypothetical protein JSR59_12065 [Proteobacteria bacterium]|nr:hypothetical protein [Pseudomonadota bacterium]
MDDCTTRGWWRRILGLMAGAALATLVACGGGSSLGIDQQPVDQTVNAGDQATFTALANFDGVDYQWQISTDGGTNFADIPGATGTSYTTPPTTDADSGEQFRVVVSNAVQSVESEAATLTVVLQAQPL